MFDLRFYCFKKWRTSVVSIVFLLHRYVSLDNKIWITPLTIMDRSGFIGKSLAHNMATGCTCFGACMAVQSSEKVIVSKHGQSYVDSTNVTSNTYRSPDNWKVRLVFILRPVLSMFLMSFWLKNCLCFCRTFLTSNDWTKISITVSMLRLCSSCTSTWS